MSITACPPVMAPMALAPAGLEPPPVADGDTSALFAQLMQPQLADQVNAGGDDDEDDES